MFDKDITRIARLTAILTQLQARQLVTAAMLARQFDVSARTIYRDIKTLEQAGVPITTEEGKGFCLMSGYRMPPVMFTEEEAQALVTAEMIIQASNDESLIDEFSKAIRKVRSVMTDRLKARLQALESKQTVSRIYTDKSIKSQYLVALQKALVEHRVVCLHYRNAANVASMRHVEPFALYTNAADEWVLVAYCRLRKELRSFSLHRIDQCIETNERYVPNPMTFVQYVKKMNVPA